MIDAYCGTGTIGLIAAKNAKKVIGVELNKDAVKDARINAKENGITNAEIYAGDAGRFMVDMASKNQKQTSYSWIRREPEVMRSSFLL